MIREQVELLHKAGFKHNDIAPRNVIFKNGAARLIDFDRAQLHRCDETTCAELLEVRQLGTN